jgi:tryptophan-rich sensory protein
MTIDQSQTDSLTYALGRSSHRTRPEQLVGLGIYLLICLGIEVISGLTMNLLGTLYFISLSFGMWALWRKYSLRVIKLELSVFLAQFVFQIVWSVAFFALEQSLLALVALLLLWCTTLLATLLFWKRERISGLLFLFPLIWIFYLVGLNMVTCMSKP